MNDAHDNAETDRIALALGKALVRSDAARIQPGDRLAQAPPPYCTLYILRDVGPSPYTPRIEVMDLDGYPIKSFPSYADACEWVARLPERMKELEAYDDAAVRGTEQSAEYRRITEG